MLQAILGSDRSVSPELVRKVYNLTEGNPFFIEELLRSQLLPGHQADMDGDRQRSAELHLPRTIREAVQRRTDRLSAAARQVLVMAAVAGRQFDFELLRSLTAYAEHELLVIMKELIAAQFVVEVEHHVDLFAFRHALTREAVHAQLLGRERRNLHRRIADIMEQAIVNPLEPKLEDLAYHFAEAGEWAKALPYAEQAAARADALYAPASAVEHYSRAIESARQLGMPVLPRLYRGRGLAYERLGRFVHARTDHEAALTSARLNADRRAEWQALLDLGFLWAGRGYEQARAHFVDALELARTLNDPTTLARSLNRIANWLVNVDEPVEGERHHREALAIFEHLADHQGTAETLDLLGLTEYLRGNLVEASTYLDQAIARFRDVGDRAALTSALAHRAICVPNYHASTASIEPGTLRGASGLLDEALLLAQQLGWRASEAFARMALAIVLGPRGEYTRALSEAHIALEIAEEIDHRQWASASLFALAAIHRDLLALDRARQQFEQALALARELASGNWASIITGSLASTLIESGAPGTAVTLLQGHVADDRPPATMGQRQMRLAAAELAVREANPATALQLLEPLRSGGAATTAPPVDLARARALRALGQLDAAESTLRSARQTAIECGLGSLTWRLEAELAAVLDARGRADDAAAMRNEAVEITARLAEAVAEDLVEQFRSGARRVIGVDTPRGRTLLRGPGGLTAREREIVIFIAEGRSNRAIAEVLVLSERTVEDHVSRVLGKLGFRSRAQIAGWAVQQGLAPKH